MTNTPTFWWLVSTLSDMLRRLYSLYSAFGPIFAYLFFVSDSRWKRYREVHRKYRDRDATTITPKEAQEIIRLATVWDMPALMNLGVSFALFKTYAIPTISRLLAQTKELGSAANVSKRYADTEILITTWMLFPLDGFPLDGRPTNLTDIHGRAVDTNDARGSLAVARTNWLHSHYNISNDDYLYTLSLFVLEPITWAKNFGWRPLSDLEQSALFIMWSEIGRRMNIKDIPNTLLELKQWSEAYEVKYMVPAETNRNVARLTVGELLHTVPERFGIRKYFSRFVYALVEDRVRVAMMEPKASWWIRVSTKSFALLVFRYIPRYLCLPRSSANMVVPLDVPTSPEGRMHPTRYQAKPWYKPEASSILGRLSSRVSVALGLYDDLPGPAYNSTGYRIEEMGPCRFQHLGHEEVVRMAEEFHGCPIKAPWALAHSNATAQKS